MSAAMADRSRHPTLPEGLIPMIAIRASRAVAALRTVCRLAPCLVAGAFAVAAHAASTVPPSPTQSTDLLLGLFVNGDLSKGQQYNDAMRGVSGGAQQVDLETYATLRAQNPRLLAERITETMPEARREAMAEPLRRLLSAVADAIGRSRCRTMGETRELDPANDEQWIAKVGYTCEIANLAPVMERLRVTLPRQQITSEKAAEAAAVNRMSRLADMIPSAPIELPVSGTLELQGSDMTGWRAPAAGDMIDVVSRPILDAVGIPAEMKGQ
ncbi:hypothetical protein [Burkholderia sp. 22PA0106]|uniref:hypothetical protein n=1 Tax=Burkholderia sp. 22PA0106 TaxID=3237371 RepID=UPI0039C0830F